MFVDRIQAYLHHKANRDGKHVVVAPFSVFLHATDTSRDANYAIPHAAKGEHMLDAVPRLRAVFAAEHRAPRIVFLDTFAPTLASLLSTVGFHEVERAQVLACTQETLVMPTDSPKLALVTLSSDSSLDDIKEGLDVIALGFDPNAALATDRDAEAFRQSLRTSRAFTVRRDGQGVGAGMFTEIHDGVTELAGIATLMAFRRQGIATMLTAAMTRTAFEHGAEVVFLVAANEQAGCVYARVGFRPCAALLTFEDANTTNFSA